MQHALRALRGSASTRSPSFQRTSALLSYGATACRCASHNAATQPAAPAPGAAQQRSFSSASSQGTRRALILGSIRASCTSSAPALSLFTQRGISARARARRRRWYESVKSKLRREGDKAGPAPAPSTEESAELAERRAAEAVLAKKEAARAAAKAARRALLAKQKEAKELALHPRSLAASSVVISATRPPPRADEQGGDREVARLAHSLDRVLFNPGVHWVQDPRSGVYNFDPSLQRLPPIHSFDFSKLPRYTTSSEDASLRDLTRREQKSFYGSTSSTTGMLSQIYLWLNRAKSVNTSMLSDAFREESRSFTMGQSLPVAVRMVKQEGEMYALDADKSFDVKSDLNILRDYGHFLEKLLTTDTEEFSRYFKSSKNPAPSEEHLPQAYHYSLTDHMVLRSQLDATNDHLPNKTFDVKTRGVIAIRMDSLNWEASAGYLIRTQRGMYESFEREYYDLIRSAFLKYQFQVRIGGMDGCFVAYHNTAQLFGFQYVSIDEMDEALFGSPAEGAAVFKLCIGFLERILLEAAKLYPGRTKQLMFRNYASTLHVYVSPEDKSTMTEGEAPVTLLVLRGRSYLDGELQNERVDFASWMKAKYGDRAASTDSRVLRYALDNDSDADAHSEQPALEDRSRGAAKVPDWTVEYGIDILEQGKKGQTVNGKTPAQLHAFGVKQLQALNSLTLPEGVTRGDLHRDAAVASGGGGGRTRPDEDITLVEPETSESSTGAVDWAARLPPIEGVTYRERTTPLVRRLRDLARRGSLDMRERERKREGTKPVVLRTSVRQANDE